MQESFGLQSFAVLAKNPLGYRMLTHRLLGDSPSGGLPWPFVPQ
jgi:hypothetical protein